MREITKDIPTGTEEWAEKNINISNGCPHDCKYCYAKGMAIRFKRKTFENWRDEEIHENKVLKKYSSPKSNEVKHHIMFPTSHDITIKNINESIIVLRKLFESGNRVLVVTKPNIYCIKRICEELRPFKDQMTFRFSIGSMDNKTLKYWEPYAPNYSHRKKCLKFAFNEGFKTSVSVESMLDNKTLSLVYDLVPFVTDTIWLGKPNQLKTYARLNSNNDQKLITKAEELNRIFNTEYIKYLYQNLGKIEKIRWKDTLKKMIGLDRPNMKGLDI